MQAHKKKEETDCLFQLKNFVQNLWICVSFTFISASVNIGDTFSSSNPKDLPGKHFTLLWGSKVASKKSSLPVTSIGSQEPFEAIRFLTTEAFPSEEDWPFIKIET